MTWSHDRDLVAEGVPNVTTAHLRGYGHQGRRGGPPSPLRRPPPHRREVLTHHTSLSPEGPWCRTRVPEVATFNTPTRGGRLLLTARWSPHASCANARVRLVKGTRSSAKAHALSPPFTSLLFSSPLAHLLLLCSPPSVLLLPLTTTTAVVLPPPRLWLLAVSRSPVS